jgi:hypothetical protein
MTKPAAVELYSVAAGQESWLGASTAIPAVSLRQPRDIQISSILRSQAQTLRINAPNAAA